jgi:hypothetical protein
MVTWVKFDFIEFVGVQAMGCKEELVKLIMVSSLFKNIFEKEEHPIISNDFYFDLKISHL